MAPAGLCRVVRREKVVLLVFGGRPRPAVRGEHSMLFAITTPRRLMDRIFRRSCGANVSGARLLHRVDSDLLVRVEEK